MRVKLKQMAHIFYGPHQKAQLGGEVKYLVASHFDALHQPTAFKESYIDTPKEQAILKEGDVIFTGKGHRFFAWAYTPDFGKAVPSSLFYIIRIEENQPVLSEYLAYLLNSTKINGKLKSFSMGTSLPSIQKNELGGLTIDLPSLEHQQKVVKLSKLMDEDIQLTKQLLEKKMTLRAAIINKAIND